MHIEVTPVIICIIKNIIIQIQNYFIKILKTISRLCVELTPLIFPFLISLNLENFFIYQTSM